MKFTQNTPVVQPNTIGNVAVRVSGDPMAYGTGGKEYGALAGAIGQMAKVAKEQQDDADAADVMEARNKIMGSLTESMYGEKGLLTNGIGENAKGLEGRVTDTVQKTFDSISKNYNIRVQRALRGNLSENMGNFQRIAAQQEGREYRKQKDSHYGLSIDNSANMAMLNYQDPNLLDSTINDALRIADWRAKDMGYSEQQRLQERRNVLTAVAGAAINKAIEDSDLETASIYNDRYGQYMNQKDVMKFQKVLRQEKRLVDEKNEIDELVKTTLTASGEPDWNKIEQIIKERAKQTKVIGGGSNDRFVRIAQETAAIIRQKYPDASPNLEKYLYGQMMRETGWGKDPVALEYNNFAGLHGGAKGRKYADDHDYAKDYASFFTDGYHTQAIYATDGTDFARRLSNKLDGGSGWYEDRNYQGYGQTIMEAMADYDKKSAAGGVSFEKLNPEIDANGVDLTGTKPVTIGMINRADQIHYEMFGTHLWVSCTTSGHDPGTPHALGDKADVGSDALKKSKENRIKFQNALQAEGIGANNEYDMPSKGSTGGHFDLDQRGKNWQTGEEFGGFKGGGGGSSRTVNAHDSGYEDRMIRRLEAARADWKRRKADEGNTRLEGYQSQIQNAGSAENALSILERIKGSEKDPAIYSKAIQTARTYYPDAFKVSNSITGTRRSGSSRGSSNKIIGASGETYTPAQIRQAQRVMNRWYKAADPNNPDEVSQRLQDQADEASYKLIDAGLYEGGADVEEQMETFSQMQATAREVWEKNQDYQATVDELVSMGWTETNAIKTLDSLKDKN